MRRSAFIFSFFLSLCSSVGFGQVSNPVVSDIIAKLEAFTTAHALEKSYLHFDKPYYAAGDTIYFKAYVVMGERHVPSSISRVLHVDLINTKSNTDQSIKLQLINGLASGDFALPDSLPKGTYRIRAYTQWMLNDKDQGYFEQSIPVGSILNSKISESGTRQMPVADKKTDVQFFPEGGGLVAGIQSKIAFKAIGANGLGTELKGIVVDNDGKQIAEFASAHLGMGFFNLTPEYGKTYQAKITCPNGKQDILEMPKAGDEGLVLKISNDSLDKARISIVTNKAYLTRHYNKPLYLFIYSGGVVTTITCKLDTALIDLALLKRHLHKGITKVTVFSETGEPLAERLLFIQNPDQLKLSLNSDKQVYAIRQKVHINLGAVTRDDSATMGNFSVSVTDESKVTVDENAELTIINNLLLTSDLKGYIEQPNYYFTNINAKSIADLDLVMLTHGYRRFEWTKVLNNSYSPVAYQPEKGLAIEGLAKGAFGGKLVNGTVSLISMHGGPYASTVTDSKGSFRFSNLAFADTGKFMLQAVNARGKNKTELVYIKETEPAVTPAQNNGQDVDQLMQAYLENTKKQLNEYSKYGSPKGIMLKEVKVKDIKPKDNYRSSSLNGPGHADQVLTSADIGNQGGMLSDILTGRLHGIQFVGRHIGNSKIPVSTIFGPLMVFVDGVKGVKIDDVNPNDVETVEVLFGANASIYGMDGGNGVIVITTKQGKGMDAKDIPSIGVLPVMVRGFYKAREFYSPKYGHPEEQTVKKDLRTTVYWNPGLITDQNGNTSFEYFNTDNAGTYRVVVEGIDSKGNLGRQVYSYKVE
ncbi:MG2 domain-containing protein [Mucilaginibacter sp.]|uniref:MG2 domain-containing protein n=1 Tax=Mucilaginibacter sp. TaxID=1882438 RepID=UPI003D0BF1C6